MPTTIRKTAATIISKAPVKKAARVTPKKGSMASLDRVIGIAQKHNLKLNYLR